MGNTIPHGDRPKHNHDFGEPCNSGCSAKDQRSEFGFPGVGAYHGVGTLLPEAQFPEPYMAYIGIHEVPNTPEGNRILDMIGPIMEAFFRNNTKYAKAQDRDLGAKGIMPDINRKAAVLLDRIWDGSPVVGEPTLQVIDDLIGHLLLLRDKLVQDDGQ